MTKRKKVGVLISGRGSNLQALLDAAADPGYPAEIALVISNRPDAAGLDRAAEAGVPCRTIDHKAFDSRAAFDAALMEALETAGVELVALAGFMRVFTAAFVGHWQGRMINIHPSLLPLFPGLDPHGQALEAGVRLHGCSVHFVTPDVDGGPLIAQAAVPVADNDTAKRLAERVLAAEHRLYPACLALVAAGRARLHGKGCRIEGIEAPQDSLFSVPVTVALAGERDSR